MNWDSPTQQIYVGSAVGQAAIELRIPHAAIVLRLLQETIELGLTQAAIFLRLLQPTIELGLIHAAIILRRRQASIELGHTHAAIVLRLLQPDIKLGLIYAAIVLNILHFIINWDSPTLQFLWVPPISRLIEIRVNFNIGDLWTKHGFLHYKRMNPHTYVTAISSILTHLAYRANAKKV